MEDSCQPIEKETKALGSRTLRWTPRFQPPVSTAFQVLSGKTGTLPDTLLSVKSVLFAVFYLFLAVLGLLCCTGFPLVVVSGGHSSLSFVGFSLWWVLLLGSTGFSSCGTKAPSSWFPGSGAQAQYCRAQA